MCASTNLGNMCHTKPCMILYYDLSSQATLYAINSYIFLKAISSTMCDNTTSLHSHEMNFTSVDWI